MSTIHLSADSTCDLGAALCSQYQVSLIGLKISLDDQPYTDGVDITGDDIFATYREKKILPKTSALSVVEYTEFFKSVTADGDSLIHFSLGSSLSVTHNNARLAAEEVENVYVIDTQNLSTGSGLLVLAAADMIAEGLDVKTIVEKVKALVPKSHASFVIDTLEFLYKGGRCSALAMLGANLLQLKPCIEVDNQNGGSMSAPKKYRGSLDKALEIYVRERLEGRTDLDLKRIFITHSGVSHERVEMVKKWIAQYSTFENVYETHAGSTICAHCGPNTLGILFMTK